MYKESYKYFNEQIIFYCIDLQKSTELKYMSADWQKELINFHSIVGKSLNEIAIHFKFVGDQRIVMLLDQENIEQINRKIAKINNEFSVKIHIFEAKINGKDNIEIENNDGLDFIGKDIDKGFRIEGFCEPGRILIEEKALRTFLQHYKYDYTIEKIENLKGIPNNESIIFIDLESGRKVLNIDREQQLIDEKISIAFLEYTKENIKSEIEHLKIKLYKINEKEIYYNEILERGEYLKQTVNRLEHEKGKLINVFKVNNIEDEIVLFKSKMKINQSAIEKCYVDIIEKKETINLIADKEIQILELNENIGKIERSIIAKGIDDNRERKLFQETKLKAEVKKELKR